MSINSGPGASDLTRIPGIGPRLAEQLGRAGITTLARLAVATPEEIRAACGPRLGAEPHARKWIDDARLLVQEHGESTTRSEDRTEQTEHRTERRTERRTEDRTAAPATMPPPQAASSRRTFTIEVRVEGSPPRTAATRVTHLETQQRDAWPGWDPQRLLQFVEGHLDTSDGPVTPPESAALQPEVARHDEEDEEDEPRDAAPSAPNLVVHRFGVLRATTLHTHAGAVVARVRINRAELGLPAGAAVVQVDLLGRSPGFARARVLRQGTFDLPVDGAVDAVLHGHPSGQQPPLEISAAVRVLLDRPLGQGPAGLGTSLLELMPHDESSEGV